jgi:two-component system response regulator VicR
MGKKILVVDDDPTQTETIKIVLEKNNEYEVNVANSGIECLDYLKNNNIPDVILLDIMMPEMNGWQVFEKIKENDSWSKIPVIFLTARTDDIAKNAGGFLGEDYVEKPYNVEDLKNRINAIFEKIKSI